MINGYYFDSQIRQYLMQFAAVMSGLQVKTGIGECGDEEYITVPVTIGNRDRVVAAIMAGNTQNRPFSIPAISIYLSSIDLAPERRRGYGVVDSKVYMPQGGVFPTDLRTLKRVMPVPYNTTIDVSLYASNTLQMHQILEQLLMMFDPELQLQKTDSPFDWTRITKIEMQGISNEENYPIGTDRRIQTWTLSFKMPIYLSAPLDIKNELVRKIFIRLGDLDGFSVSEVDENGNLQPFQTIYGSVTTDRGEQVTSVITEADRIAEAQAEQDSNPDYPNNEQFIVPQA